MISEKDIIEMIRECKTKEQLFTVFEETSNNKMEFWDEDIYKAARGFLKQAMGNPETHYGPQHGQLSEKEMFEQDVEMVIQKGEINDFKRVLRCLGFSISLWNCSHRG